MAEAKAVQRKSLFLITEYKDADDKKQSRWTRVGVGFVNKDGSVNIRLDEGMVLMHGLNYQLRDPKAEDDEAQMSGVLSADKKSARK